MQETVQPDIVVKVEGRHPATVIQELQDAIRIITHRALKDNGLNSHQISGMLWGGRPSVLGTIVAGTGERGKILWRRDTGEIRLAPPGKGWKESLLPKTEIPPCYDFEAASRAVSDVWGAAECGLIKSYSAARVRITVDEKGRRTPLVMAMAPKMTGKPDRRECVWSGKVINGCIPCITHNQYVDEGEVCAKVYIDPDEMLQQYLDDCKEKGIRP
jgi:hypothetical protein